MHPMPWWQKHAPKLWYELSSSQRCTKEFCASKESNILFMNSIMVFCCNTYRHNARKLYYTTEMWNKYDVVCLQEHLLTSEHYCLLQINTDKDLLIHEATSFYSWGWPSGETAIIASKALGFQKVESCKYYIAIEIPGANRFVMVNVYLPTNMNTVPSEKQ